MIPFVDIFAGPGGLGEGFSAFEKDGSFAFRPVLSIEMEPWAHETLTLRSFFRQFRHSGRDIPEAYYGRLRGKLSTEDLFRAHPEDADAAQREARRIKLGGSAPEDQTEYVDHLISESIGQRRDWVLLGGPPCQAYSLVGRSRMGGIRDNDPRVNLFRQYLRILSKHQPAAFVFENVKGLASSKVKDRRIFEEILTSLESPADYLREIPEFEQAVAGGGVNYRLFGLGSGAANESKSATPSLDRFLIKAEEHGIPQARHRIIIVGLRSDLAGCDLRPLSLCKEPITVSAAIRQLPKLRSGLSKRSDSLIEWRRVLMGFPRDVLEACSPELQSEILDVLTGLPERKRDRGSEWVKSRVTLRNRELAEWFLDDQMGGACNHATRSHLDEDLWRYLFAAVFTEMDASHRSPTLGDFPDGLLPKHQNARSGNFADRFRVQTWERPSTTITSHISKDGHYYIHPDPRQCRSLTVREAARLQTFPDNYFFCGPRTAQYVQVGNAVPPLLARKIAEVVHEALQSVSGRSRVSSPKNQDLVG